MTFAEKNAFSKNMQKGKSQQNSARRSRAPFRRARCGRRFERDQPDSVVVPIAAQRGTVDESLVFAAEVEVAPEQIEVSEYRAAEHHAHHRDWQKVAAAVGEWLRAIVPAKGWWARVERLLGDLTLLEVLVGGNRLLHVVALACHHVAGDRRATALLDSEVGSRW